MKELRGRVAVVTGGASGIGKALAKAFLGEGMKVVIADVEAHALEAACRELGGEIIGVVTDVAKAESVQALADKVFATHGACHILCNNAGVSAPNLDLWETEPSDFRWVHGVNVNGVAHGVQAFVPRMIASGEEGFVMNTSSGDGGISPLAQQVVYASSKAAVSILTECLAAQLVGRGTKACTPWATPCTLTPCTHWKSEGSVSQRSRFGAETPALLQRMWQAPWVANTVSARACTDSNFDTSQTTPVTPAPSSCVAAASAFCSTSAITTFMPSPRKAFARALPIPLAPPVTTATRPLKSFIADHLLSAGQLSDTVSASGGQDNLRNANNRASRGDPTASRLAVRLPHARQRAVR